MLFTVLMLHGLAAAPALPAAGRYKVLHDSFEVSKVKWEFRCGKLPTPEPSPKGTIVEIKHYGGGKEWWVKGAGRRIGSNSCEGENQSLKVVSREANRNEWQVACKSQRVTRGTEETTHTASVLGNQRVQLVWSATRTVFVRRSQCVSRVDRKTVLVPVFDATPEPPPTALAAPAASTAPAPGGKPDPKVPPAKAGSPAGGVPAAPAATTPTDGKPASSVRPASGVAAGTGGAAPSARELEAALEAELRAATREQELAPFKLEHTHLTSDDFTAVSARYVLDGREVASTSGAPWGALKRGQSRVVVDDFANVGTHVLEVELVYAGNDGDRPFKITLKDAAFFEVTSDAPLVLKVVGYEDSGWFSTLADRPKLRFELNGKALKK